MAHAEGLPQTGDAQEIGQDAADCLAASKPRAWRLTSLGGTEDYGLDYQVQLVVEQQVVHVFRVQLKGTRSPKPSADGSFLSIALSASTLRYYDNIEEPVLLVLCDLSVDISEPRNCPLYFVWMPEELKRISIDSVPLSQEEVTIRVSTANRLARDTNLLEEVRKYHEIAKIGHALDISIATLSPKLSATERMTVLEGINEAVAVRSMAFAEALAESAEDFWISPARDSLPWHLTQARDAINHGKLKKCAEALDEAETALLGAPSLEVAEYWHLRGRLYVSQGQDEEAASAFRRAADLRSTPKYWAAWAECELRKRYRIDTQEDFSAIAEALPSGNDPLLLSVKARLLAASQHFDEALALLDTFPGAESLSSRAVVQTMCSKNNEALQACVDGLSIHGLKDSTRRLFLVLRARARFNLATSSAVSRRLEGTDHDLIPPAGLPGTDASLLWQAWANIQEAAGALEEIDWSSNAEFLVDIWVATASMLGKQREILAQVLAVARKRSSVQSIQVSAEAIAAQCGDFNAALEVNDRLFDSDLKILRRVTFLHEAGKHRECVYLMEASIAGLDTSHQFFGSSMMCAALSASILARDDLLESWSELLNQNSRHVAHGAVLSYFLTRQNNKLSGDEPLLELERRDAELGHPAATSIALAQEFEPTNLQQAERFLAVADRLRSQIRLSPMLVLKSCIALSTLERWPELLALCVEAEQEFDTTSRIKAFKGLALDRLGRTEDARKILASMIEGGISDGLALNTYVNIMVRWGYVEQAASTAEKIMEATEQRDRKIECVRLLFNLQRTADPQSRRLIDLALRMGELVDPSNEVEEGVFLSMVLMSTSLGQPPLSSSRAQELQIRAAQFFERFPSSKVLRRIETDQEASGEEIVHAMKQALGLTAEREQAQAKMEAQLQRGELPIPYAWRPKNVLTHVQDVAHLWELGKRSTADDKKYHLNMVGANWSAIPSAKLRRSVPILDLTTLLVLQDLDLLEALFKFFPTVAIGQETLGELMKMTQGLIGSLWSERCISLREELRLHLKQIMQPHAAADGDEQKFGRSSGEILTLVARGTYSLFSDDVLFRIWCLRSEETPGGICTLDLLCALEEDGELTTDEVALKLSLLCAWHVGVQLQLRHQVALIPDSVLRARSVDAGVGVLQATEAFMSIANGIWDFRSDFVKGVAHVASVARELVQLKNVPTIAIASFIGVWYVKAKLRHDAPLEPLQILNSLTLRAIAPNPHLDEEACRKLWSIYLALVEFEYKQHMDEAKEREAYRSLAREAAEIDAQIASQRADISSLKSKLETGLTPGTEAWELFSAAYSSARIASAVQR